MVRFMLPGFYEKFNVNKVLIESIHKEPHIYIDDIEVAAVYGSFQVCIWNGGRVFSSKDYKQASYEDMVEIRDFYKEYNIPVRFTYTNNMITEDLLDDVLCNLTMELFDDGNNEVVVCSDLLENYIREKYPSYKIISSTTKRLDTIDKLVEELSTRDYYLVCLDYDLNNRFDEYDKIPDELKSKCEFLVNAICPPYCVNRKEHYRLNSVSMNNYGSPFNIICPIQGNTLQGYRYRTQISQKDILEKYIPSGFNNFKIEGRTLSDIELLENYCRYLVKDEHKPGYITSMMCRVSREKR